MEAMRAAFPKADDTAGARAPCRATRQASRGARAGGRIGSRARKGPENPATPRRFTPASAKRDLALQWLKKTREERNPLLAFTKAIPLLRQSALRTAVCRPAQTPRLGGLNRGPGGHTLRILRIRNSPQTAIPISENVAGSGTPELTARLTSTGPSREKNEPLPGAIPPLPKFTVPLS
jgi:hypothetical protein